MKKAAQGTLLGLLMLIPCQTLFGQSQIPADPPPAAQSEPDQAAAPAPSEPVPEDPLVKQIRQDKEELSRQIETLRDQLAEAKEKLNRNISQKSTLQNTLTNLQQVAGACRTQINEMRPTIVIDADVIRKTDSLLVWSIVLDKSGPIFAELEEINEDGTAITRRRQTQNDWNKTHILPFIELQDHTPYRLVVYSNTNQSGSASGETVIGDPKAIGDLTSETEITLPVGRLEFSSIEFRGRKAQFRATARDAPVRATFRCAKYVAHDKERLSLRPQSVSEWIAPPPVVKEQDYVPTSGILIQQGESKSLECPEEIEPNALYQVQFEGLVEASGRKLEPVNNDAYPAPVAFDFDEQGFGLSFNPEKLTVTWGATLPPTKATLALLVDEASKKRTDLVNTIEPNGKAISLTLPTEDLLKRRIKDKKIDEPLTFQISMERDGEEPITRLFRVNYLVDGSGGLTKQQKDTLQKALESFANNKPPAGKITWQEVFRLGLPVVMSLL
jgi:hypothetical protein